jgi:hypothetical protein
MATKPNRTARWAQASKVRHLKKQARGQFTVGIVSVNDAKAAVAHRHLSAAVAAGKRPQCLACSYIFRDPQNVAAFLICSNARGTKAGQIAICKNCYVLRREQLPLFVNEVLQKQLGISGVWRPGDDAD